MTDTLLPLSVAPPPLVIIADGASAAAQSHAKGHLFEVFMGRVFEAYGYETPTKATMNVRSNGYEVDVSTKSVLHGEPAIAECKAYTASVPIKELKAFYGALTTERFDHPNTKGWFVAIPGLTPDAQQLARKLEASDPGFKVLNAHAIHDLVISRKWIQPIERDGSLLSDQGILLTQHGVCAIAKELDPDNRLPIRVLVQRKYAPLSNPEKTLLAASEYAESLRVEDVGDVVAGKPQSDPGPAADAPTLVTVVGSREDFEYQYPAAPQFFVGRKEHLRDVQSAIALGRGGQVLVLNAQSGWGKSSLALRIAEQVQKAKGTAIVFDSRTAASPPYVAAAIQRASKVAMDDGTLTLASNYSFASLQSAVSTLESATWRARTSPLLIFFDQFENVFRDTRLTQEFRNLALAVREMSAPVWIGFSWKTDLVGMTEDYPFRLRDDIRDAAFVINVRPFGPNDVGTLLGRLARAAKTKISLDLRLRVREYSQGLPWLLKKLASHILSQLRSGTSEAELLAESLNIEQLFAQDTQSLEPAELDALKSIARQAPVAVSDVVERVSPEMIQSLVHRRLLVQVGERIDTYWDTFREFLVTGNVAVEDSYILRLRPISCARVLQAVVKGGGEVSTAEVVQGLDTSQNVVFNAARELRQVGVLSPRQGILSLVEQLELPLAEADIKARVSRALRRHKVYSVVQQALSAVPAISIDDLGSKLPPMFPAIDASGPTWRSYADAFMYWFDYAGLFSLRGQLLGPADGTRETKIRLLGELDSMRRSRSFPQAGPDLVLKAVSERPDRGSLPASSLSKATSDLISLGVFAEDGSVKNLELHDKLKSGDGKPIPDLLEAMRKLPGGGMALDALERSPSTRAEDIGALLRDGYGVPWAEGTMAVAGKKFRAWARLGGMPIVSPRKQPPGK